MTRQCITFEDGTVARAEYHKPGAGIWFIVLEERGSAQIDLHECTDEDDDPYSDVLCIDAEIEDVEIVEQQGYEPCGLMG